MHRLSVILILMFGLAACNPDRREPEKLEMRAAPAFDADSAFTNIERQLAFGHRIPGTEAHRACGNHLVTELTRYGFEVSEQTDTVLGYDSIPLPMRNIIAKLHPERNERVMLAAHWDSRPFADQAQTGRNTPIPGANDNASGVAVIMEIARLAGTTPPTVGLDIVLFDVEDQGRPAFDTEADPQDHGYCLGSIYWSEHFSGTRPQFGILLDMVGAKGATFTLEHYSMKYAAPYILKVWDTAHQLGYGKYFVYNRTQPVVDDHMYINEIAKIPCLDVIHQNVQNPNLFWKHWHTHQDDLNTIDRQTLKAVGQTVIQVVYNQ